MPTWLVIAVAWHQLDDRELLGPSLGYLAAAHGVQGHEEKGTECPACGDRSPLCARELPPARYAGAPAYRGGGLITPARDGGGRPGRCVRAHPRSRPHGEDHHASEQWPEPTASPCTHSDSPSY